MIQKVCVKDCDYQPKQQLDSAIINWGNIGQTVVKNHIHLLCICMLTYTTITAYDTVNIYFERLVIKQKSPRLAF